MTTPSTTSTAGVPATGMLPFTLTFTEQVDLPSPLPGLHSYSIATPPNQPWLIFGGRRRDIGASQAVPQGGLHGFETPPSNAFKGPNTFLMVVDPKQGLLGQCNLQAALPGDLAEVLCSTNQQFWYDNTDDMLYVVGGYGQTQASGDTPNFTTFGTLLRFPVTPVIEAVLNHTTDEAQGAVILPLIERVDDPFLAVTGGELFRLPAPGEKSSTNADWFFLVFGQNADGQYSAFTGEMNQTYTCCVKAFKVMPGAQFTSRLLEAVPILSDPQNFHRRDGNIVETVDAASGQPLIAAYGGVFLPGIIGAYRQPVYITQAQTATVDPFAQRFSSYECPVISVWDANHQMVYETFFGGIGHFYFHQSPEQTTVYNYVTSQGRNDGLPFTGDITTLVRGVNGVTQEWIFPEAVPAVAAPTPPAGADPVGEYGKYFQDHHGQEQPFTSNMRGASTRFIPEPSLLGTLLTENGVARLEQWSPGDSHVIGYIYGGIEARYPLPIIPSNGTKGCSALYTVTLTLAPQPVIDAAAAQEAIGNNTDPAAKAAPVPVPTPA